MSKELIPFDIGSLTAEQLEAVHKEVVAKQINNIMATLKEVNDRVEKFSENLDIVVDEQGQVNERMFDNIEKTKNMAASSQAAKSIRFDFISLGDFGRLFEKSIGSKTMGNLLKVVGLAQSTKSQTIPYREYVGKYARTAINSNTAGNFQYSHYYWHYELCLEKINGWLKENRLYERFYSVANEKEMKKLIDGIYNTYV